MIKFLHFEVLVVSLRPSLEHDKFSALLYFSSITVLSGCVSPLGDQSSNDHVFKILT